MTTEAQRILDETRWIPKAAVWVMISSWVVAVVILCVTAARALIG